jgi:hypothetical protein
MLNCKILYDHRKTTKCTRENEQRAKNDREGRSQRKKSSRFDDLTWFTHLILLTRHEYMRRFDTRFIYQLLRARREIGVRGRAWNIDRDPLRTVELLNQLRTIRLQRDWTTQTPRQKQSP